MSLALCVLVGVKFLYTNTMLNTHLSLELFIYSAELWH